MPQLGCSSEGSQGSRGRPPLLPGSSRQEGWVVPPAVKDVQSSDSSSEDEDVTVQPDQPDRSGSFHRSGSNLPGQPPFPPVLMGRASVTSTTGASTQDFQRVFNSLSVFRSQLMANQKAVLNLLDEELDKVKRSPGMGAAALARGSTNNALDPQGMAPVGLMRAASGAGQEKGEVKRYSFNSTFPSLPSVAKARKRRMSWIQKTNPLVADDDGSPSGGEGDQGDDDINWTKEDREKARKEAEDYQKGGMLSQLNEDLVKDSVRKRAANDLNNLAEDVETVRQNESVLVRMAMHPWFERITMAVIFLNAVWISVDIEFNDADILAEADLGFIIVENMFCTFFTFELILRYMMFVRTWLALQDPWFMFDVFLLTLMIFETWLVPIAHLMTQNSGNSITGGASVLRVARVLRVLRTARMARLVRLMPELMILIKGMMVACRSVFFTLVLLLLFTYVFSVAFMQFSRGTALEQKFFNSMGTAIWTLILKCILTDQQVIIEAVAEESWVMAILMLFFILFGSLTVMNMLLGVLVEAIKTVSTIEREQLEVDFAKKCLWEMIDKGHADQDGDNRISEEEYRNVLRTPQAMAALTSLGVDVEAALDYGRLLFEDGEPLTFGDFMRGILTLRGSNQTTVKDIVDLRKFTADEFSHIHEVLNGICKFLVAIPVGGSGHVAPSPPSMSTAPAHPIAHQNLNSRSSFARSSFASVASYTVTEENSRNSLDITHSSQ